MKHDIRRCGVLMHPTSFPSPPHGIGSLGDEAFTFIDLLSQAKASLWQILPPLGPTGYGGDSLMLPDLPLPGMNS